MRLSKPQTDRVKEYMLSRFNIVDLLKSYGYELSNDTDNRMKMKCPFHNEKTASFMIYLDTNRFHCFGCAESGSVINLIMNHEEKTYYEVIEDFSENVDVNSNKFFADTLTKSVNKDGFNVKTFSKNTEYELSVFLREVCKKKEEKIELVDNCFREMDMFFSNPDNLDGDRVKEFSDSIIDRVS